MYRSLVKWPQTTDCNAINWSNLAAARPGTDTPAGNQKNPATLPNWLPWLLGQARQTVLHLHPPAHYSHLHFKNPWVIPENSFNFIKHLKGIHVLFFLIVCFKISFKNTATSAMNSRTCWEFYMLDYHTALIN